MSRKSRRARERALYGDWVVTNLIIFDGAAPAFNPLISWGNPAILLVGTTISWQLLVSDLLTRPGIVPVPQGFDILEIDCRVFVYIANSNVDPSTSTTTGVMNFPCYSGTIVVPPITATITQDALGSITGSVLGTGAIDGSPTSSYWAATTDFDLAVTESLTLPNSTLTVPSTSLSLMACPTSAGSISLGTTPSYTVPYPQVIGLALYKSQKDQTTGRWMEIDPLIDTAASVDHLYFIDQDVFYGLDAPTTAMTSRSWRVTLPHSIRVYPGEALHLTISNTDPNGIKPYGSFFDVCVFARVRVVSVT